MSCLFPNLVSRFVGGRFKFISSKLRARALVIASGASCSLIMTFTGQVMYETGRKTNSFSWVGSPGLLPTHRHPINDRRPSLGVRNQSGHTRPLLRREPFVQWCANAIAQVQYPYGTTHVMRDSRCLCAALSSASGAHSHMIVRQWVASGPHNISIVLPS